MKKAKPPDNLPTAESKTGQEKSQKRRPRYTRAPITPLHLVERDLAIMRAVSKYRFLNSAQIKALVGGSKTKLRLRLQKLFHHGYLDRPRAQLRSSYQGSDPIVYGLGNKGADLLAQELGLPRAQVDWTTKNRTVGPFFLKHTLLVSQFMVCLELALRAQEDIKLIQPEELILTLPAEQQKRANPLSWSVNYADQEGQDRAFGVHPDRVFGLLKTNTPAPKKRIYLLEADRSTMPLRSANFRRSSYEKKLALYWASYTEGILEKIFNCKALGVLTLALSEERIRNMLSVSQEVKASPLFLFAPAKAFTLENPSSVLTAPLWREGKNGTLISLL